MKSHSHPASFETLRSSRREEAQTQIQSLLTSAGAKPERL
jgi:hypothetical protein